MFRRKSTIFRIIFALFEFDGSDTCLKSWDTTMCSYDCVAFPVCFTTIHKCLGTGSSCWTSGRKVIPYFCDVGF